MPKINYITTVDIQPIREGRKNVVEAYISIMDRLPFYVVRRYEVNPYKLQKCTCGDRPEKLELKIQPNHFDREDGTG